MICRLVFLLFIAQCAFGLSTKFSSEEQSNLVERANGLKRKSDPNSILAYFDAELESRLLKMSCQELTSSQHSAVFHDDGDLTGEIIQGNGDSNKVACVKNDCTDTNKLATKFCVFESPPKTTTTPAPAPTTTEPSGASQLAALSHGLLLILGVLNYV